MTFELVLLFLFNIFTWEYSPLCRLVVASYLNCVLLAYWFVSDNLVSSTVRPTVEFSSIFKTRRKGCHSVHCSSKITLLSCYSDLCLPVLFAGLPLILLLDTVVHPSVSPLATDDFDSSLSAFDAK